VEKIEGDQKKKAIYTLLPPEGTRKNLVLVYALLVVFNVVFVSNWFYQQYQRARVWTSCES
jgi:hypothetical protein